MADNTGGFGLSFAPLAGQQGYNANGGSPTDPIQEAIQILSLRRPNVVGAGSPVPGSMLNAPPHGPDINSLLQLFMRQFGQQSPYRPSPMPHTLNDQGSNTLNGQFPPMQAPTSAPAPSITFQQPGWKPTETGSGTLDSGTSPLGLPDLTKDRRV